MHEVALAFFWHQHQPYYPDDVGGENPMPWVRLHGTKDYWGMAALLKEVPELHATINLVPSLLVQLAAYTEDGRQDTHQRISRLPADGLSEDDANWLLDNFFMVHPDQMIRPFPRYHELYKKRGLGVDPAPRARKRFSKKDLIDLQCWSNLVWIHPLAFEQDAELAEFRQKGRGWTEQEKQWLLDKQMELLAAGGAAAPGVDGAGAGGVDHHALLSPDPAAVVGQAFGPPGDAQRGAAEAPGELPPTTPGSRSARRSSTTSGFSARSRGGCGPRKAPSAKGSFRCMAEAGVQWIGTDEEILSCSTDGWVSRDSNGYLRNPEMLYRPWRVEEQGKSLQIVFRDHAMSDQIGFHYYRYAPEHAVGDFIGKLEAIGNATGGNAGNRPTLVSIILDGENCWEYYPNAGVEFLRGLYRRVVQHAKIKPVRIGEYLARWPAADKLGQLFPGSWIQHNFGIWIGHPECNQAWDLLHETRRHLLAVAAKKSKPAEKIATAWKEMSIAEGSDWFWWFGDSHSSAQSGLFDRLFRKHLQNVYLALDEQPPTELAQPIRQGVRHAQPYTEPTGLLRIKVDGRRSYFEWINAGRYVCGGSRGAMSMVTQGLVSDLYFGFDAERLFLRLDARGGPFREQLAEVEALRVVFVQPEGLELSVAHPEPEGAEGATAAARRADGRGPRRGRGRADLRVGRPLPQPGPEDRRAGPLLRRIAQGRAIRRTHPARRGHRNHRPLAGL